METLVRPPREAGIDLLDEEGKHQGERNWLLFQRVRCAMIKRSLEDFPCKCAGVPDDERSVCLCRCFSYFVGMIRTRGNCAGSQSTYLGHVRSWAMSVGDKWNRAEYTMYNRLKKAADAQYARTKEEKQTALESKAANKILEQVEEVNPPLSVMLYLQGQHGTRHNDTYLLQKRDLIIEELVEKPGEYEVGMTLRRGKNIKTCKDKRNSRERTDGTLLKKPKCFHQWAAHYAKHRVGANATDRVFNVDTSTANRVMRKAGCKGTTYGFRKHYAAKKFVETGGDLVKLAVAMGHSNFKMTQGFYRSLKDGSVEKEYQQLFKELDKEE
jgi:integrase